MKTIEERARDLYNMLPIIQEYYIDTIARALRDAMRHQKSIDTRKACDWSSRLRVIGLTTMAFMTWMQRWMPSEK